MPDTIQIVEGHGSSSVLLDINSSTFGTKLSAPPPPLRRTVAASTLTDGDYISDSAYGNRTLSLDIDLVSTTQDLWAAAWQTLARQINRDEFWIKYQPTGATSAVWFQCYRSDSAVEDVIGAAAYRTVSLEIPAYPFAWGAAENISSFTITNNPSSGTNRMQYALPTIKGDVETPLLLAQTSGPGLTVSPSPGFEEDTQINRLVCYRVDDAYTSAFYARDLSELTSSTDVGSTVTGAGNNYIDGNYKACTFATTTTMATRLSGSFSTTLAPMPGVYRALIRVVAPPSGSGGTITSVFTLELSPDPGAGTYVEVGSVSRTFSYNPGYSTAMLLDFGLVQMPLRSKAGPVGLAAAPSTQQALQIRIRASQTTGAGGIRFDELFLIPAETTYGSATSALSTWMGDGTKTSNVVLFDSVRSEVRALYDSSGSAPFNGIPIGYRPGFHQLGYVGQLPTVKPDHNNYLIWLWNGLDTTETTAFTGRYYPRYLHVRPAST